MANSYDDKVMNQVDNIITAMGGGKTPDYNGDGKIHVQDQLAHITDLIKDGGGGASSKEVKELKEEVEVLSSRMDTFTHLDDGSTTGDAELQDIRVGADGTVYTSAGTAVRSQVTDLKSAINTKVLPTEDLIPYAYAIIPSYINANGAISFSTNWRTLWFKKNAVNSISMLKTFVASRVDLLQIAFYNSFEPSASTFISGVKYVTANAGNVLNNVVIPSEAQLILVTTRYENYADTEIVGTDSIPIGKNRTNLYDKNNGKFVLVGYSRVNNPYNYVIDTAEMYNYVGSENYDMIKGDVQITSDNALVMCHDAGFTLDANGKITSFDSENYTPIRNMTLAQVQSLVFAQQTSAGNDMHVPTFDEYMSICKKWRKTSFITLRDEYMDTVIPIVFSTLDKYGKREDCIINSLTIETLRMVRENDGQIPTMYTVNCRFANITNQDAYDAATLGNSGFGFYATSAGTVSELENKISANLAMLGVIKSMKLPIYCAITKQAQMEVIPLDIFDGVQTTDPWE